MIHYDLQCEKGHLFDGWFASSAVYDQQAAHGQVACTICGSVKIEKQLMAPGIPARANKKTEAVALHTGPENPQLTQMLREYRKYVEAHSEDVGKRFAEEARKIHYKETEERGIRGQATRDEVVELLEEGITPHPLPTLPEDSN